jgi:hypothetical protein
MSITISDAELITAQDAQSRHPVVEIVSSQNTSDIPFDGQFLTEEATNETKPNVITHSTGRLCQVYTYGSYFKYVYTDVERQEFNFVTITLSTSHVPIEATLCELENGNIGIIYISTIGAARHLRYIVLSPTGVVVTVDTLIASYTTATTVIDMPFVIRLANGTFLLVYYHYTVAGTVYRIEKRTCPADFTTWSAESECSVGGLTATFPKYNPLLMQLSVGATAGNIFLWFDYRSAITGGVEITNIYYSISTDNGVTWAVGVALTTYATTVAVGKHPVSVQKVANEMMMSFSEVRNALYKAAHDSGIPTALMVFDSVGRKLYSVLADTNGSSGLYGVSEVDVDSWTETNWWDEATDPAFDPLFCTRGTTTIGKNDEHHGEYPFIPVAKIGETACAAAILNVASNTITHYYFETYAPLAVVQNVTGLTLAAAESLSFSWVDAVSNRIYFLFNYGGIPANTRIMVGYIEIGSYEWHEVIPWTAWGGNFLGSTYTSPNACWLIDVANDRIFISSGFITAAAGRLKIFSLSTGALISEYNSTTHPDFPNYGMKQITRIGEKLFGNVHDTNSGADHMGLTEIDLTTELIQHHVPDWAGGITDFYFGRMIPISDEELVIKSNLYGLTIFNIITNDWELLNNANVPGLTPNGVDAVFYFGGLEYDAIQKIIFAGICNYGATATGALAVSRYGAFKSTYYKLGIYSAGWTFGTALQLVAEWTDYDLVMAINPGLADLSIYAFWTKMVSGELSIKWDLDASSLEISDYIVNGSEVSVRRSIDSSPASLTFICSHGHLFDPQNIMSLYSIYLKKGRKINLRFGENVSGTEYWQQQGVFFVCSTKLTYERPNYPIISIEAKDERVFWEQGKILVTDAYETDPNTILTDLMTEFGEFAGVNIHFPTLDNSCILWFQWLDVTLQDIVMQVCERFGYFHRLDVDGHPTARKISGDNAVDHVYSDVTKLINFTPDDDFSNFVNQVIVTGQSHTFIEVLYAEERIQSLTGTVGWWGDREDYTLYYSTDMKRRCRNARLKIVKSSTSIAFKIMGDIDEELSYEDPNDFYCIVTVEVPSLIVLLAGAIALLALTFFFPLIVCVPVIGGPCQNMNFPLLAAMMLCMNILGSVANFQYEIWAQPVGKVRQSFQSIANDEEFQALIGKTITETIDDPLCFSQEQCQLVANFNRDVLKFQRNRITFTKIADLRDEEGDMLQVPHPYTNQLIKILVTDLSRRYQKPASPGSNDGHFLDDIEGWRIL